LIYISGLAKQGDNDSRQRRDKHFHSVYCLTTEGGYFYLLFFLIFPVAMVVSIQKIGK